MPNLDPAPIRAAHVLAVILWIGGVGFVTTVLLPAIHRDHPPGRRLAAGRPRPAPSR